MGAVGAVSGVGVGRRGLAMDGARKTLLFMAGAVEGGQVRAVGRCWPCGR